MSLLARIKILANGKGVNIAELERQCSLGNGTIRKWDYQSPSIDKVIRLADWLNVSLDYLIKGEHATNGNLSEMEDRLLQMYRELDQRDQQDIWETTQLKFNRTIKKDSLEDSDSGETA